MGFLVFYATGGGFINPLGRRIVVGRAVRTELLDAKLAAISL